MVSLTLLAASLALATASSPQHEARAVTPVVLKSEYLGLVSDPTLDRDGCSASKFGDRALWTCADTTITPSGFLTSTASWTDYNSDMTPQIINQTLRMYGNNSAHNFFPIPSDECGATGGFCSDHSRWPIWPYVAPMVGTTGSDGTITGYNWIPNPHLAQGGKPLIAEPSEALYRVTYNPKKRDPKHSEVLPSVALVDERIWAEGEIPYGNNGFVVHGGVAYLYAAVSGADNFALAKVPVGDVEDKAQYQYFVNGTWTKDRPTRQDARAVDIPNCSSGGKGTWYYSSVWNSFVHVGGRSGAEFFVSTAPAPEGPWAKHRSFFNGTVGNYTRGVNAYSWQGLPDLVPAGKNQIYLTYSKVDFRGANASDPDDKGTVTSPLYLVTWK